MVAVRSAIRASIFEEDDPGAQGEDDPEAEENERGRM
jgi:hypothetical protein